MPARLVSWAFLPYLCDWRWVRCLLGTEVIDEVVLDVIGVLLVDEIVPLVTVGVVVIGVIDGMALPTPREHPPGEAECEAPSG